MTDPTRTLIQKGEPHEFELPLEGASAWVQMGGLEVYLSTWSGKVTVFRRLDDGELHEVAALNLEDCIV